MRHLGKEVSEAKHRGEWIVQIMRDPGDELANSGHLFGLNQLILQSSPLSLVVEQQDHSGSIVPANWHSCHGVSPFAGAQFDLPARSLLVQSTLEIDSPLGRDEGLPGPTDKTGGWCVHQVGKGTVGATDSAAPVHNAQRGGNRVYDFLPGPPAIIMKIHKAGTLERYACLGDQAFEQNEVGGPIATCLTARRNSSSYSAFGDERCNEPASHHNDWWCQPGFAEDGVQIVVNQQRSTPTGELQQWPRVGSAGGPAEHKIDGLGLTLKQ